MQSKTVIVDNYISSFGYHIENGIPIISWFDDKSDHEVILVLSCHFQLYNLSTVLMSFLSKEDIRPSIEELFHLKKTLSEFEVYLSECICFLSNRFKDMQYRYQEQSVLLNEESMHKLCIMFIHKCFRRDKPHMPHLCK